MPTQEPKPGENDDLAAPKPLVDALLALQRERILVPETVDAAILRRARQRLTRRRWLPFAAAAAVLVAGWLAWLQFGAGVGSVPMDVNRDGRVDIRDALMVARQVALGGTHPEWDFNGDGVIDQRDAETIARRAVELTPGGA